MSCSLLLFLLEKNATSFMQFEIWDILTLTCLGGTSWELWFNGLEPLLKGLALAWASPEHGGPLSQGKAGVSHGRGVITVDNEVQIKCLGPKGECKPFTNLDSAQRHLELNHIVLDKPECFLCFLRFSVYNGKFS